MASPPLHVEELVELLRLDFTAGLIPQFQEGWLLEDPVDAVLSTTSSLLAIVNSEGSPVVQFSHFSVKEFLTLSQLAESNDVILRRYHVSMTPAHTLALQALLGMLLHLDKNMTRHDLEKYPLAEYAAKHWVDHARFKDVTKGGRRDEALVCRDWHGYLIPGTRPGRVYPGQVREASLARVKLLQ